MSGFAILVQKRTATRVHPDFDWVPIAIMLKYPEPYRSKVRIGEAFQAKVPNWSDQSKYVILLPLVLIVKLLAVDICVCFVSWQFISIFMFIQIIRAE